MGFNTTIYIRSEAEFNRAKIKGFWDIKRSLITGRLPYLLPFDEAIAGLQTSLALFLGLQDIPLKKIVGSVRRPRDFTRHFMPHLENERDKERWRIIYSLAVSGTGFPPIDVFQVGPVYFVQNGHHRVSVASYLGWPAIQANVTLASLALDREPKERSAT